MIVGRFAPAQSRPAAIARQPAPLAIFHGRPWQLSVKG
jgi:hypothetical protein